MSPGPSVRPSGTSVVSQSVSHFTSVSAYQKLFIVSRQVQNIPTPVRMTPCPFRLQTLWTGGILRGTIKFCRAKCLKKVVHTRELDVLSIKNLVRMTPCPPRLHHQTSWTGRILMEKMTFQSDECLAKVVYMMDLDVLSIKTPVRMTPCLLRLHHQTS